MRANRPLLLVLCSLLPLILIGLWLARDQDPPPAQGGQPTLRLEAEGRVLFEGEQVAVLPTDRRKAMTAWEDAMRSIYAAVLDHVGIHGFPPGGVRDGVVLEIEAASDAPWTQIAWLMHHAGYPDLRIPKIRLAPDGAAAVLVPLTHDPGHTGEAYLADGAHVHATPEKVALYADGVWATSSGVLVDEGALLEPALEIRDVAPRTLARFTAALRKQVPTTGAWHSGTVALTWPLAGPLRFGRMAAIFGAVVAAEPAQLHFSGLPPDELQGR